MLIDSIHKDNGKQMKTVFMCSFTFDSIDYMIPDFTFRQCLSTIDSVSYVGNEVI